MRLLRRYFPTLVWLATLLVFAGVIARTTVVADLSAFMPSAPTGRQQLLIDQFKEGIIARLVIVGIEGGDAAERARVSRELAAALRQKPDFIGVQNGSATDHERDRAYFFDNRYLLSPAVDAHSHSSMAASSPPAPKGSGRPAMASAPCCCCRPGPKAPIWRPRPMRWPLCARPSTPSPVLRPAPAC